MVLAWKKFQVSDALMLSAMAAVCELLPSVSENARNKASIAICRAIFLLECEACSACSACSRFSCALIDPSDPPVRPPSTMIAEASRAQEATDGRLNAHRARGCALA